MTSKIITTTTTTTTTTTIIIIIKEANIYAASFITFLHYK
jgi:hypothetical protein